MHAVTLIEIPAFTIVYEGRTFDVETESVGINQTVYLVKFPGGNLHIALTRATGLNDPKFWTTIPENIQRHEEAQQIGQLIFDHFNRKP